MSPLILSMDDNLPLAEKVCAHLSGELGKLELRSFPDGESYINILSDCRDRKVILLGSLHQPNEKVLQWLLVAETLRDLGAKEVGLVVPYLAYMRQDIRFKEGEGITSRYFACLISRYFDWLVTVDPHLHRYDTLNEIYSIPCQTLHAAETIAQWISNNIERPLLVGPDIESEQWVASTARMIDSPYIVLQKIRHNDFDVEVSLPSASGLSLKDLENHTPILVDDIISTGSTMIETATNLLQEGFQPPVAIGVHGLFAQRAYEDMLGAGIAEIITCNSVRHASNRIELAALIAQAIA